jgi:hypothetical protein
MIANKRFVVAVPASRSRSASVGTDRTTLGRVLSLVGTTIEGGPLGSGRGVAAAGRAVGLAVGEGACVAVADAVGTGVGVGVPEGVGARVGVLVTVNVVGAGVGAGENVTGGIRVGDGVA